ncbi:MAG TPA: hypothetical protein VFV28_08405, partial [Limnobacter sp.]|nr:hypothetical protein [Limnobacter sp.]
MPLSTPAGSAAQSSVEPFHSPYRTEASFKQFSTFLNRKITLNSRSPNQFARFSPLDILKQLDVSQAYLKGSSVHHWKDDQPPSDIDFQICSDQPDKGPQVVEKLLDFLETTSGKGSIARPGFREKQWFNKVVHDQHGAWNRTLLSLGFPGPRASTVDLNITNRPHLSYDTIHASKAIFVDWANRKTAVVDCWHPALVQWMQQARLLWFNPDIDEGLGRLSYRLSKSPDMQLLQPEITEHFFRQASTVSTGKVFMRVLLGEYRNSSLLLEEQAGMWKAVLDIAASGSSRQHQGLLTDMLAWSRFNKVEQLQQALLQGNMRETVIQRLKQGAQVGADFKESLRHVLQADTCFKAHLEPLLGKALGARLMSPETLFNLLDQWEHLQGIPENEMQSVFMEYLRHWSGHGEPGLRQRCKNMLGWLEGDETSSLNFWMDRIPARSYGSPADRLSGPVVEAALQLIKSGGFDAFIQALPVIENLRLKEDQLYSIIDQLMEHTAPSPALEHQPNKSVSREFFELLTRHLPRLVRAEVPIAESNAVLKDCLSFSRRVHTEKAPALIRSLVSTKGNTTHIELEDVSLAISNMDESMRLEQAQRQLLLTPHCIKLGTQDKVGSPREVKINWHDGTVFTGMMQTDKSQTCTGKLEANQQAPVPEDLKGLIEVGRILGLSKWPELDFRQ